VKDLARFTTALGERATHLQTAAAASIFRQVTGTGVLRRTAAGAIKHIFISLPAPPTPSRAVFVIGCPRSGTTLLYDALASSPALGSLGAEGHVIWEAFNHPSRHGWSSNALGPEDITSTERKWVYRVVQALSGGKRFLDKTPRNCLRVPYLNGLFPDATFIFLRRRAADTVSSLIEGWRAWPRFVTYRLPEALEGLGDLSGHDWSFPLVPGWRELRRAPLEEICARQYVECNEAMIHARAELDAERTIDVAYEDLVARPSEEISCIFGKLGLAYTAEAAAFAASLPSTHVASVTPPRGEKWRDENPNEIQRILPLVAATERRLGY
jgi:hypothetical protein